MMYVLVRTSSTVIAAVVGRGACVRGRWEDELGNCADVVLTPHATVTTADTVNRNRRMMAWNGWTTRAESPKQPKTTPRGLNTLATMYATGAADRVSLLLHVEHIEMRDEHRRARTSRSRGIHARRLTPEVR